MDWIDGGVTAPQGFRAAGVACGLKRSGRPDLALLVSAVPAVAAGVFTSNRVKGHSLVFTKARLGRPVRGVLINSGSANACLGPRGDADAVRMAQLTGQALGLPEEEVLLASTGVIGQPVNLAALVDGVGRAAASLSSSGGAAAAEAIMTTDTFSKQAALSLVLAGRPVKIGGMAKGSGMIHPNLATLLGFLTTDAAVGSDGLNLALREAANESFNSITVDGDTSPCDSVLVLANGRAGGEEIERGSLDFARFCEGLLEVAKALARMVARDGEGATKLIAIRVSGAGSNDDARLIGRGVATSCLVKTAIFGADANWGRILSAVGNAGVQLDPDLVSIRLGGLVVCAKGGAVPFDEEEARSTLTRREVEIAIDLGCGPGTAVVWTCDLGYDYVRINGSYRS